MKTAQRSFAYGEVAPALYARPDLAMYSQALRTLRNAYVMRAGGVQSRPGTMKGITTKAGTAVRLVPCVFADDQNYILEFGDEYVRVLLEGQPYRVPSSGNWVDETEYALGVIVSEQDATNATKHFLCIQAHESIEADNQPIFGTDWEDYWYQLDGDATTSPAVVWPTPYTQAQLSALRFAQTPGVITIVHPEHAPAQLTRVTYDQWTLADINFAAPAGVLAPGNFVGTIDDTGIASWVISTSYPLNRLVKRSDVIYRCIQAHSSGTISAPGTGNNWEEYWAIKGTGGDDGGFWYVVTAVDVDGSESPASTPVKMDSSQNPLSPTWRNVLFTWDVVVDAVQYYVYRSQSSEFGYRRILSVAPGGYAADTNPLNTAYISTDGPPVQNFFFDQAGEYPSTVSFYQQRLLFAASNDKPDTVWASVTGKPFDFNVRFPIRDDDAIEWRQLSRQSVEIRHLVEIGRRLVAFTNVGEYIVTGADDGVLRPGEVNPTLYSYNGANSLEPIVIDNTALYVQARGSRVLRISPEYQDEPAGSDLSLLATHLLEGYEIVSWAYQEVPNSLVWMVRNDGVLLCLSYVREAGITAWSKCDTDGTVEGVCCVPEGGEDALYMVVKRGGTRYIERFVDRLADDPICLDAAYYADFATPSDVTDLPPDGTYRYARISLSSPYAFTQNDVGSWIQLLRNSAAWIAWEIYEVLSSGAANVRLLLADAPAQSSGEYTSQQWVYRAAAVAPDPLVVADDPDAPVPNAAYVTDAAYDGANTTATVNMANPVFTLANVGARVAFETSGIVDAWTITAVSGPMTAILEIAGDYSTADGTYLPGEWAFQPNGLDAFDDKDPIILIDGAPPVQPDPVQAADIVGARMYTTDSTQRQQGTAELYYSDDGDTWTPGPIGYVTNEQSNVWDGVGLGSCGQRYWLGSSVAVLWTDVQPGMMSTVGLKSNGTLWGWGTNNGVDPFDPEIEFPGMLGLGPDYPGSNVPVQIGSDKWKAIAVGERHFAAIRSDGTLWASGKNDAGQLGQGDTDDCYVLTQIGSDSDWVKVFAGFKCTMAIRSNGTLWVTGDNQYGQLGIGSQDPCYSMTQVGSYGDWKMVSPAADHTMAIRENGTMWACGNGQYKEAMGLGDDVFPLEYTDFVQVGSDSDWEYVDTGSLSIALKSDGTIWSTGSQWGWPVGTWHGIYAAGFPTNFEQVGTANNWQYVTTSYDGVFGIKTDGSLWSWGENRNLGGGFAGRLGLGDYNARWTPVQVGSSYDWLLIRAGHSYIGGGTTAVFGVKNTFNSFGNQGELFVWGTRLRTEDYDNFGIETDTPFTFSVDSPESVLGVIVFPGKRRYWRYVAGDGHPTISRLWLIDSNGLEYPYAVYSADNCGGTGDVPEPGNPGIDLPAIPAPILRVTQGILPTQPGGGPGIGKILVGLPYNVDIETLDLDSPRQSIKNDPVRVGEVFVWLDKSGSFYVGPKATDDTSELELYTPTNDEGYPLPEGELYTGVAPVTLRTTYTRNGRIFIRQPDPKPLTVTAIIAEGLINGRG